MTIQSITVSKPFFSVCIPQYNRTSYLLEACKVLAQQTFRNFEICISDDRSTERREEELITHLKNSGLSFIYQKQEANLRYDGNIRASIALARGKYCFLHGNDDCLVSSSTLEELHQVIQGNDCPAVVITNFEDWQTGQKNQRIRKTQRVGAGVTIAATHFRNVAFVSGVIIDCAMAQACSTDRWDGSEMYQMYLTSRLIASGGLLLELDTVTIRKDIQIVGELVDSYATRPRLDPCPIVERELPMGQIGELVADAISPYLDDSNRQQMIEKIFLQLYLFTYPFWIIEYRRVQSWNYALGVSFALSPKHLFWNLSLGLFINLKLSLLYLFVMSVSLFVPIQLVDRLRPSLFLISKSLFSMNYLRQENDSSQRSQSTLIKN